MPIQLRITYSVAVALAALGAVLYFVKVDSSTCVVSYAPTEALSYFPRTTRPDSALGLTAAVAKTCSDPIEMTTTRIWGMSLAAFALVLIASMKWLEKPASTRDDFDENSD